MEDDAPPTRLGEGSAEPPTLTAPPVSVRDQGELPPAVGGYRILRKLGEGGMGIVYEAEQSSPRRTVALKVVRGGPFVDEVRVKMFQREAEALARLKHPNIGAIFEAGRTADGQHFFAMELVTGRTLSDDLRSRSYDQDGLRRRLNLFRALCEAVHYAHQRGVIHRDLKPSNIVITEETSSPGAAPSVKILDFGLARITDADVRSTTLLTEVGVIKGTLAYMSPEQTKGGHESIDVRADVYALGVILYEMVAGRRPYEIERTSLVEALRVICEEPPRPLGRGRGGLDADIETIVMKALEKDPERRYGSAADLGSDVERYLTSQPILARPPSAVYQLRKFAARNKALVGGLAATILVLMAGVVVSSTFGVREARQRRAAERVAYVANVTAAEAGLRLYDLAEVKRRLAACPPSLRGWEWRHLAFRSEMSERTLTGHTSRVYPVAVSPDGRLFVSGSADPENTIRFWDAATGEPLAVVAGGVTRAGKTAGVRGLAFSPDGARLASASDDRHVRIWDVASGRKLLELTGHDGRVNAVAFIPDGREIVSASFDRTVRRWDAASGASLAVLGKHEDQVWGVAVCGDGARIVSGSVDGTVRVWERATGRELLTLRAPDGVLGVACSPTGDRVAAAVLDGTVRMWDVRTGAPIGSPGRHDDLPIAVAFSRDGRMLASAAKDRTVRLWDGQSGEAVATLVGHDNVVTSVAFDQTGKTLISGSWDRTVRVWSIDSGRISQVLATEPGTIVGMELSPDGKRILSGSRDDGILVRDAASGAELARIPNEAGPLLGMQASSDGTLAVAFHEDGRTRVWELAPVGSGRLVGDHRFEGLNAFAFLPGGSEALIGFSAGGTIRRWRFRTDELLGEVKTALMKVDLLELTPDGSSVVVAGAVQIGRTVLQIIDLASGRLLAEQEALHIDPAAKIGNPILDLAFSPDGARLVSAQGQDFTLRMWDGRSLRPLATMPGHTEMVRSVGFSPDGTRIVSGADDYTVRLWDAARGEPLLALRGGLLARVGFVAFTPDGSAIVSGETTPGARGESAIRMWRTLP